MPYPKSKPRRRTNRRRQTSKVTRAGAGAPLAVSEDLQQRFKFRGNGENLIMETTAAVSQVYSTVTSQNAALTMSSGTVLNGAVLGISGVVGIIYDGTSGGLDGYISPIWDLIGSAFVRYRIHKCEFEYEPQSSATAPGRLVFAYAEDPCHPIVNNSIAGATQTSARLLAVSDSVAFMPWRAWRMDITSRLRQENRLYTDLSSTDSTSETNRFASWGCISCVTDSNGTAAVGGILYMHTVIEFSEFCPISVTRPSLLRLRKRLPKAPKLVVDSVDKKSLESTCRCGLLSCSTCTARYQEKKTSALPE
jgi:hypothetical protein